MSKSLHINIILKNGYSFVIDCEEFTVSRNGLGDVKGFEAKRIRKNKPIYIDVSDISAIVREVSNEMEGIDGGNDTSDKTPG